MIVAIVNLKGGVGKTTSAIALATAASRQGLEVRVLDADPQGSATMWADLAEEAGEPLPFEVGPANVTTVKRLPKRVASDEWVFIDCPPNGNASTIDLQQSYVTASTLEENDKLYALLLTRIDKRTLSFKSTQQAISENHVSCFDAFIPQREEIKGLFGHRFGEKMHGYKKVLSELQEACNGD